MGRRTTSVKSPLALPENTIRGRRALLYRFASSLNLDYSCSLIRRPESPWYVPRMLSDLERAGSRSPTLCRFHIKERIQMHE